MIVGVNVSAIPGIGLPAPADIPAELARFQAIDGPPFVWTASYARQLRAAGKRGLARFNWRSSGVRDWAENVDVTRHEYGNEIPPANDQWHIYRRRLEVASPILRAAGRRVGLAAPRTNRTLNWLETTPGHIFEACDFVALHPYAVTPGGVLSNVVAARALVPDHLPLAVTEFGWSIGIPASPFPALDETNQARLIGATLALLERNADALNLELAVVFMLRDVPDNGRWWRTCGLVRQDGEHKPSFDVVAKAAGQ